MSHIFIAIPLLSIIILNLPFRRIMKKIAVWLALALSISQIFLIIFSPPDLWNQNFGPLGALFKFDLMIDGLSRIMLLCIGMVLLVSLLVGRHFFTRDEENFNFVNLLLITLIGMNGVALVTDIFSLFLFMEITAIASFILVAFKKNSEGYEAAFKYIILSGIATVLMFASIALLLLVSGATSFTAIHTGLDNSRHNVLIMFAIGLFLCGLFIKGGLVPFHAWLPDAHSAAPAAVSIVLSGVQIKVLGAYAIIRLVNTVFGYTSSIGYMLLAVGMISIFFGALAALGQRDFKRMLAYSSISNMGYIILGFGCGTGLGTAGALFHLFNHAVFKSLLFVNAAAVESRTGTRDMDKMGGLGSKMPLTSLSSVLASLSAAGVPPLAGFWSKLIIVMALWGSGHHAYAVLAVLGSLVTLAYFLSMQRRVFFGRIKDEYADIKEAGFGLVFPALILSVITVGVGLIFPFLPGITKFWR
jgi:multicomponent Na+:H+ antiporter subunit D